MKNPIDCKSSPSLDFRSFWDLILNLCFNLPFEMCIFGRPQVIISGSDAFKETEVRKWNQPRQSGVGRTFIRRTPGEKFEETSRTCSKLKKCSNSNVKSLRDICQVSLRKLRISSEAGRKIIFKFDCPGPRSPEWLVNSNICVHFYLQTLSSVHSESLEDG